MIKVYTSSVQPSSTLSYCSIHTMYNRVNRALKISQVEVIHFREWFIVYPNIHHDHFLYEELFNGLYDWIEKHPDVMKSTNLSDSLFVKINGTPVKKQKHMLQISEQELRNDLIITIYQGWFFGARSVDGKVCIGYMSLSNYIPRCVKPTRKRNKITQG